MREKMRLEEKITGDLSDRTIIIIGPRHLQNRLLARCLKDETGTICHVNDSLDESWLKDLTGDSEPALILIDSLDTDMNTILLDLKSLSDTFLSFHLIAPFNINSNSGNEAKALTMGVRGFFYGQDPLEQILKGIRTIFANELWVSREILTKCILDRNIENETDSIKENVILTDREIEILNYVAAGTKNEEIAEKLFISPHTVRTHIYNIFKKINVPNRLQAALWAVQNL
jgi:LuxR family transcriptional regulator, positive regulator of biofilm formation